MFSKNDKVIVAVSGGPDSMCLLHVLNKIKYDLNIEIIAAHVNHCLRGDDADKDELYVKEFCNKLNIDFYSIRVDVNELSKKQRISSEMAGRLARYKFFESLKNKIEAQKIAIAHNANDQAETILMRIMRGTGISGIVGIKPVRDKIFVRPLIKVTREEIEDYCKKECIDPRIDITNFSNIYSRNKVRLEIIPYIKKNFNRDIVMTLNRLGDSVNIDNDYLDNICLEKYKLLCMEATDKIIIHKEAFLEHKAIITRIIRKAFCYIAGNTYNFENKHILDVIDFQQHKTGTNLDLPNNIKAYNNYGDISIYFKDKQNIHKDNNKYELIIGKYNEIPEKSISITLKLMDGNEKINFSQNNFRKYFDYDRIKDKIILRYRKNGDKFTPMGMKGSKKLKDIFIDMKIEKSLRDKIPLICFGEEIAWIVGYRVSDKFKIQKNTEKILEISFEGEVNNDGIH